MDMLLQLRMMVKNELTCYTINQDGSIKGNVCFVVSKYSARENRSRLDRTTIPITVVFKSNNKNCLM